MNNHVKINYKIIDFLKCQYGLKDSSFPKDFFIYIENNLFAYKKKAFGNNYKSLL